MSTIPDRLRVNGRPPDDSFDDLAEELYRRIPTGSWPVTEDTLPLLIASWPICVARGRYCEAPTDVLYPDHFNRFGVVSWTVGDIPPRVDTPDAVAFLRLAHVPEGDFYPHSEIRTYKTAEDRESKEPKSKQLKRRIRQVLGSRAKLRHLPPT